MDMDSSSVVPNNIVAVAMSTANVAPLTPAETNPPTPCTQMVGSPSQPTGSTPVKMLTNESMDVSDNRSPVQVLPRHRPQNSNSPGPQSMETTQRVPTTQFRDEDTADKTVVMRTDGKDPHLVTVTPPALYPPVSANGDSRMQHLSYNTSSEKQQQQQLLGSLPIGMPLVTKTELGEADMRAKPRDDTTYPITCGNNKADLVWKKFICPGINAKCVKCGDNWYTPKEFVNCAGKATLKDWKRAIRINGVMLRKMIENGELNYFDHEHNCSNQCRSNKQSSFDNSCERACSSFEGDTRDMNREPSLDTGPIRSSSEDLTYFSKRAALASAHNKSQESASGKSIERSSSEDSGMAPSPHLEGVLMRETSFTIEKIQDLINFWNGIIKMDLFDDVVRDVLTQITNLHSKTKHTGSVSMEDAVTMTNLVNSLEMIPGIANRMSIHKHKVEKEAEESTFAIQELERKLAEQKKYEQDLKRKSQHLDNVISLTPTEKRQKRNIIRIGRQKAVESRLPPGTSSSPGPSSLRDNVMLASGGRLSQRELWPQAIQVEGIARAASSQMARMNVSGGPSVSMSPLTIFPPPNIHHSSPEAFSTATSLHQALVLSQASESIARNQSRENTHSPKK